MGQNIFNTESKQSTQSITDTAGNKIQLATDSALNPLYKGKEVVQDAVGLFRDAKKLILSQTGVFRQMCEAWGGVKTGDNKPGIAKPSKSNYTTRLSSAPITPNKYQETDSPTLDPLFVCGDIYMPLNIRFTVAGSKTVAQSQLVDGITIYERIANNPQTINVSFIIQRLEPADAEDIDRTTTMGNVGGSGLYKLTSFIKSLYLNDEVFEVENSVLNNEFGVSYVFIKDYNFSPQQGSTFGDVSMTLQEVNIKDPLLYTNSANATQYGQVSTTANPNG